MGCIPERLNEEEESMLHVINWMEASYKDRCWVIDADLKEGSVALYGPDVNKFRMEFNRIMTDVYNRVPAWRGECYA